MYLDAEGNIVKGASLYGWKAVAVPGTVMGLDTALTKYGTMPRARVMAAAIRLARDGFVLGRADTDILEIGVPRFKTSPAEAKIFLRPDGTPLQPGDRLMQPDLATTLQSIADHGPDAFYKGAFPHARGGRLARRRRPSSPPPIFLHSPSPRILRCGAPIAAMSSSPPRRLLPAASRCVKSWAFWAATT